MDKCVDNVPISRLQFTLKDKFRQNYMTVQSYFSDCPKALLEFDLLNFEFSNIKVKAT